jgi:hypothetical protein
VIFDGSETRGRLSSTSSGNPDGFPEQVVATIGFR